MRVKPNQLEELKRMVLGRSYDEEALPELNPEAIDFRAASELFRPLRNLNRNDLRSLQLTTMHQRREVATHIGRTPRAARERLNHRVQLGSIVAVGTSPSDPRRVFHPAKR